MIKLYIDPISRRVNGYCNILPNTPIFNDDILIDESELEDFTTSDLSSMVYNEDGSFRKIEDEEDDSGSSEKELQELSKETDEEMFLRLLMEGVDINEARTRVNLRKTTMGNLKTQIKVKTENYKSRIREFYISKDKEKDESMSFIYFSSVILLIKDENRYLDEWITWHIGKGFDHIYIYDNGSKERVDTIIDTYSDDIKLKITIVDWTGEHKNIQQDAYNHFLRNYAHQTKWALFIDSDEFVNFTDTSIQDVNTFLERFDDYTEIYGPFVEYNANGLETYDPRPVKERFTETSSIREGIYYKNFIQVNRITEMKMHYAVYDKNKHFIYRDENNNKTMFVIEHYYTKSWEEWKEKIARGSCDPNYLKRLREFFLYNPNMRYLDTGEEIIQTHG